MSGRGGGPAAPPGGGRGATGPFGHYTAFRHACRPDPSRGGHRAGAPRGGSARRSCGGPMQVLTRASLALALFAAAVHATELVVPRDIDRTPPEGSAGAQTVDPSSPGSTEAPQDDRDAPGSTHAPQEDKVVPKDEKGAAAVKERQLFPHAGQQAAGRDRRGPVGGRDRGRTERPHHRGAARPRLRAGGDAPPGGGRGPPAVGGGAAPAGRRLLPEGPPAERRGGPQEGRGDRAPRRAQPLHAGHGLRRARPPGLGAPRAREARRGGPRQPPLPLLDRAAGLRRPAVRDGGEEPAARDRARPAPREGPRQPRPLLRGARSLRRGAAELGGGDPARRASRRRDRPGPRSTSGC